MRSEEELELQEALEPIAEYYSEITGRNISLNATEECEIRLHTSRNDVEYFESIDEAEFRIKQLYKELFFDDNFEDDNF
jgi:hypothetical protein